MFALAALLIVVLIVAVVYGRAIVYAHTEEYKMDQRIKKVIR